MAYLWTPPAGSYIIDQLEEAVPFSVSVSVTADSTTTTDPTTGLTTTVPGPAPTGLTVDHDLPDIVTVTITGTTATFSGETLVGLFPMSLDVLVKPTDTETIRLNSWDELTDDMDEIIRMNASDENVKVYPIQLTASGPMSETITVFIRIWTDYTINANTLKQEVAKRGFKPV